MLPAASNSFNSGSHGPHQSRKRIQAGAPNAAAVASVVSSALLALTVASTLHRTLPQGQVKLNNASVKSLPPTRQISGPRAEG